MSWLCSISEKAGEEKEEMSKKSVLNRSSRNKCAKSAEAIASTRKENESINQAFFFPFKELKSDFCKTFNLVWRKKKAIHSIRFPSIHNSSDLYEAKF